MAIKWIIWKTCLWHLCGNFCIPNTYWPLNSVKPFGINMYTGKTYRSYQFQKPIHLSCRYNRLWLESMLLQNDEWSQRSLRDLRSNKAPLVELTDMQPGCFFIRVITVYNYQFHCCCFSWVRAQLDAKNMLLSLAKALFSPLCAFLFLKDTLKLRFYQ